MENEELIDFGGESIEAASITVMGVGGGGGNAVNRMYNEGIRYVNFIVCNTDQQDLQKSLVPTKIRMGEGRGCGSDSEKGEEYAKEKSAEIQEKLKGTEMLFIAAGMGGGTGTGAAPVVAEIAKNMDILTVAIVTLPYKWEGQERMNNAIRGVEALRQNVDSVLVINNESLTELYGSLKFRDTFAKADETLSTATKAIAEIMQKTGFVNVDFNDVKAVLKDSGVSVMTAGSASGENRAYEAVERALNSPLLNKADIRGAKKVLLNITSTEDNELTGEEVGVIMQYIRSMAGTDVNITWGYMMGAPESGEEIGITMIATGFEMEDIPEFRKEEAPVVHKYVPSGKTTFSQTQVLNDKLGTQGELFGFDETGDISVNKKTFDYEAVKRMSDISQLENIPAYKRNQQLASGNVQQQPQMITMTKSQEIAEAVENRINGTAPSRVSIDKDSKGIILGDNKYLNHNVD